MVNGREGNKHTILRAIPIIFYLIFGSILRAIRVCSLSLSFKSSYTQSNEKSEAVQPLKQKPHKLSHILSWSSWIYGLPLTSNRRVWKGLKKFFIIFIFSSLFLLLSIIAFIIAWLLEILVIFMALTYFLIFFLLLCHFFSTMKKF